MKQIYSLFVITMTFIIMTLNSSIADAKTSTTSESNKLPERHEIEDKYKWNLKDLFPTVNDWETEFKAAETLYPKLKAYEGKLGESASTMLEFFKLDEELEMKLEKLRMYASLNKDLDLRDTKYQAMFERIMNLYNKISAEFAFVVPEIIDIPDNKMNEMLKDPKLKHFDHYLDNILRKKAHTLDKDQEMILALAGPVGAAFMNNYRMYIGADVKYPVIKDENGNDIEMSPARYMSAMTSKDRAYRERAYKAIYVPYMNSMNFLTSNFNGSIKANIFRSKSRKYNNTLEAGLNVNNIPVEVYKNLVKVVRNNLAPLHRYASVRKKLLNLEDLHPYDTYVTLFEADEKRYTPDEAMNLCLKALKPLGEDYIKNLKFAFDNRWVDFYETPGKRSGAYSTGAVKGVHPYVLMNWGYTLNDVFTLAHEMGHNMHSWYTSLNQAYPYADYPIFLAEVASTMNEALLMNYLLENAETKAEKLVLIETALNGIKGTFYRQTRFAEFEMKAQEMIEKGIPMTPDKYAELFGDMYQEYWGKEMIVDEEERNSWPRIHHFYYNFYVYQYATSYAASEALVQNVLEKGQPAIDKYLEFLKSGKINYAIPTLKIAGVDMSKPEPVLSVINKTNALLDQLEELIRND